jgi:hypothetical protein
VLDKVRDFVATTTYVLLKPHAMGIYTMVHSVSFRNHTHMYTAEINDVRPALNYTYYDLTNHGSNNFMYDGTYF